MFRLSSPVSPPLDNATSSNSDSATCRQHALARSGRKLARHHPGVKLPPRLEDKSKEEQIRRCCDRFRSYPSTVDTLIRALSTILRNPAERKYRRIHQANPGYQRSLAKVPGAEQLLMALGFTQTSSQTMFLSEVDRELLPLALSILEHTKETLEYQEAKKEQLFAKDVTALLGVTPSVEEQSKREGLLSQLPREPSQGRSAVMTIHLGDNDNTTLTRRFDGDDTLQDVLNWFGGNKETAFLEKLVQTRQWSLVDVNRQGQVPIDCQGNAQKTLQHLGFWPSGRLALRPSSSEWIEGVSSNVEMGASRGLGSAPSETLPH